MKLVKKILAHSLSYDFVQGYKYFIYSTKSLQKSHQFCDFNYTNFFVLSIFLRCIKSVHLFKH